MHRDEKWHWCLSCKYYESQSSVKRFLCKHWIKWLPCVLKALSILPNPPSISQVSAHCFGLLVCKVETQQLPLPTSCKTINSLLSPRAHTSLIVSYLLSTNSRQCNGVAGKESWTYERPKRLSFGEKNSFFCQELVDQTRAKTHSGRYWIIKGDARHKFDAHLLWFCWMCK